jgi:hypothetical protein
MRLSRWGSTLSTAGWRFQHSIRSLGASIGACIGHYGEMNELTESEMAIERSYHRLSAAAHKQVEVELSVVQPAVETHPASWRTQLAANLARSKERSRKERSIPYGVGAWMTHLFR